MILVAYPCGVCHGVGVRLLDAEMDKCQLLCKNCHMRKTYGYPLSTTVF